MATFSRRRNAKDQIMCKIGMNSLRLQSSKRSTESYVARTNMHQQSTHFFIQHEMSKIWNRRYEMV